MSVAPFTGAWIEIATEAADAIEELVAPFTGAWIEIRFDRLLARSHRVAPFTGAWIEIINKKIYEYDDYVAPFTGAWIEIGIVGSWLFEDLQSLPSRERGLKCCAIYSSTLENLSLPSRERGLKSIFVFEFENSLCRSLHGSVDWNNKFTWWSE